MAAFLFWNLKRNRIEDRVARLVVAHDVDVLMLAECVIDPSEIVSAVERGGGSRYSFHGSKEDKVHVFSRLGDDRVIVTDSDLLRRLILFTIRLDGFPQILLAVAHLPSRRDVSRGGLAQLATRYAGRIREIENLVGHRSTLLVGDLNMNPFDDGVVGGLGFHGVMTRAKAYEIERHVSGELSPFFYNPMWGFFGDRTPGPPGTYYLSGADPINYFWNIYDQVLVRPDLIPDLEDLAILDHDGRESLVTAKGMPREARGSDHLPLFFRLVRK